MGSQQSEKLELNRVIKERFHREVETNVSTHVSICFSWEKGEDRSPRMGLWALVCAISDQNICGKFECYAKNILPQFQGFGIYVITIFKIFPLCMIIIVIIDIMEYYFD